MHEIIGNKPGPFVQLKYRSASVLVSYSGGGGGGGGLRTCCAFRTVDSLCAMTSTVRLFIARSIASFTKCSLSASKALVA